jgi:hypothetical protein
MLSYRRPDSTNASMVGGSAAENSLAGSSKRASNPAGV